MYIGFFLLPIISLCITAKNTGRITMNPIKERGKVKIRRGERIDTMASKESQQSSHYPSFLVLATSCGQGDDY